MRAKDPLAEGMRVRCPGCKKVFRAGEGHAEAGRHRTSDVAAPKARRFTDDTIGEEGDGPPTRTSRCKRKKAAKRRMSAVVLVAFLLPGAALVAAASYFVYMQFIMRDKGPPPAATPETKPPDTRGGKPSDLVDSANLRRLALAVHAHHNDYGGFPSYAICDANGKPLLSWRVALLPYLEQKNLHALFRLDEPWDSPHNLKVLESAPMPEVYRPSDKRGDGKSTPYRVFYNPTKEPGQTLFTIPHGNDAVGVSISQVNNNDGLSGTLLIVTTQDLVPWTKPDEISLAPGRPLPKLGYPQGGPRAPVVFGNMSVTGLPVNLSEKTVRALATWDDGLVVDPQTGQVK